MSRANATARSKTEITRSDRQLTQSFADSCYDGIVVGEEYPTFLRDLLVSDPDGEFTAATFDQFNVGPERVFDGSRHTGGTWPVGPSDFTKTNSNFTHGVNYTTLRRRECL